MPQRSQNSLIHVLRVLALRGIGVVLGVLSAFLVAILFGASAIVDAYFFARRTIGAVQSVNEVLVETLMVPILVGKVRRDGPASLRDVSRRIELVTFVVAAAVCIGLALGAEAVIALLAPGLDPEALDYALIFFVILLITVPISLLTSVKSAILLSLRHFSKPAAVRLLPRLFLVCALLLVPLGVDLIWAAMAFVVGNIVMMVVFYSLTERVLRAAPDVAETSDEDAPKRNPARAAAIVIFGLGTFIETTIDTYFASLAGLGALAILTIGQRISNVGATELNRALLSVYFTNFAELAAAKDRPGLANEVVSAVRAGLFFLAPLGFFLFALADPLCRLLLDFGAFDANALSLTAQVVAVVALATVLRNPVMVIENAVLADLQGRHAVFAATSVGLGLVVRVATALALLPTLGVVAVAWSAITGTIVRLLFGALWLRWDGLRFEAGGLRQIGLVVVLAALAAALAHWGMGAFSGASKGGLALGLTVTCLATLPLYLAAGWALHVPEARRLVWGLRAKLSL